MTGQSWQGEPLPEIVVETPGDSGSDWQSLPPIPPNSQGSKGRTLQLVAVMVGVLALAGVGVAGVLGFSGGAEGGDTPQAAVERLVEAVNDEDIVAGLEIMAPSEVGRASELYPKIVALAVRDGEVTSEDVLAGVDIEMTDMVYEVEQLHDAVAIVHMRSGTISVTVDPAVVDPAMLAEMAPDLDENNTATITIAELEDEMRAEMSSSGVEADLFGVRAPDSLFMMTIERNGTWYVSPLYTLAEFGRQALDLPAADFDASRADARPGAATAEGVVGDLEDAVNAIDFDELVERAGAGEYPDYAGFDVLLPPDEIGVFLDYAGSYQALVERLAGTSGVDAEQLQDEIGDLLGQIEVDGQILLDIDTSATEIEPGLVRLDLVSGRFDIDVELTETSSGERVGLEAELSWDGLCGEATLVVDGQLDSYEAECAQDLPLELDNVFVVVGEVDGTWYVSYVETVLAYVELGLDAELAS